MYRTIDTDTWDDPWFAELEPRAKLLFLYFVTNRRSTPCGCFEITTRQIAFETGLSVAELDGLLPVLHDRIYWWPDHQVVFVRNFYRHQHGKSNKDNFLKGAIQSLAAFPLDVQSTVGRVYPELLPSIENPSPSHGDPMPSHGEGTPSHGYKETVAVAVTESVPEAVAVEKPRAENSPDKPARSSSPPFDALLALCDATGADAATLSESVKSKQSGVAKRLLAAGMTVDDIGRCAGWLQSQHWRDKVDMLTIEQERGSWELAGKPAKAKARASPNGPHLTAQQRKHRDMLNLAKGESP